MKPIFVAETNPHQPEIPPPGMTSEAFEARLRRFALYPRPRTASGYRLCSEILQLDERTYLRAFDRIDLCHPRWSLPKARELAARLVAEREEGDAIVILGAKVSEAFGLDFAPFTVEHARNGVRLVTLPHPSRLCRIWHEPGAFTWARETLTKAGVLPVPSGLIRTDGIAKKD